MILRVVVLAGNGCDATLGIVRIAVGDIGLSHQTYFPVPGRT